MGTKFRGDLTDENKLFLKRVIAKSPYQLGVNGAVNKMINELRNCNPCESCEELLKRLAV